MDEATRIEQRAAPAVAQPRTRELLQNWVRDGEEGIARTRVASPGPAAKAG
ncbi:MAG: hypothetical protein ACREXP_02135 [Steroidobacteraceae bacterium]